VRIEPRQSVVVTALRITQIFAWGCSYYLLAVLATPITAGTGWSLQSVVAGISLGLFVCLSQGQRDFGNNARFIFPIQRDSNRDSSLVHPSATSSRENADSSWACIGSPAYYQESNLCPFETASSRSLNQFY
jgi:hypothetical protein